MTGIYIFALFEHSAQLEQAIAELENEGVSSHNILAVPLNQQARPVRILDTINQSDGLSLLDGAMVLGTIGMVLGVIYGYVWQWGPILWGLIGFGLGTTLGLLMEILRYKKNNPRQTSSGRTAGVVILVNCETKQADRTVDTLSDYSAVGIGRYVADAKQETGI